MVRLILLEAYTASVPKDPLYTILYSISTIEVGLAFIVACAPSMKPLLKYILPKLFGSSLGYGRTTARNSRIGYELSETPRKGNRTQSRTKIEASGNFDSVALGDLSDAGKSGIVTVKETDIRWQEVDVKEKSMKNATSTESLV
jgi:hypothetical protein